MKTLGYLLGLVFSLALAVLASVMLADHIPGDMDRLYACTALGWLLGLVYQASFGDFKLRRLERRVEEAISKVNSSND